MTEDEKYELEQFEQFIKVDIPDDMTPEMACSKLTFIEHRLDIYFEGLDKKKPSKFYQMYLNHYDLNLAVAQIKKMITIAKGHRDQFGSLIPDSMLPGGKYFNLIK